MFPPSASYFILTAFFFQLTLRLQEVIPYEISKLSSKKVMTIFWKLASTSCYLDLTPNSLK